MCKNFGRGGRLATAMSPHRRLNRILSIRDKWT